MDQRFDIIIIGGGAAGFFTAINIAEKKPNLKIVILERGKEVLTKVRISGGGRCNVTHACFQPHKLVAFYPRGEKELIGPFHRFSCADTLAWFKDHDVFLKTEDDGRIFPVSNTSKTIIDCFLNAIHKLKIKIITGQAVQCIEKIETHWIVRTQNTIFSSSSLVIASGSNLKIWDMVEKLGHKIIPPVPSLFTFNIEDKKISNLSGISVPVTIAVEGTKLKTQGPLLFTHWGVSGPAVLKLSAWGARILFEKKYQFTILVNWLYDIDQNEVKRKLQEIKHDQAKKNISKKSPFDLPNRLWEFLIETSRIPFDTKWADVTKTQFQDLAKKITHSTFQVHGKSTFKDEFVTAGGIHLKEINFKTMQSKRYENLFFAGEVIDVDAITGGFNFQNAWTTGFIVAESICKN